MTDLMTTRTRHTAVNGFTLIEVLIVVAIMGILAALAYPSYSTYVIKTKRSDAHLALLSASQFMERCRTTAYSYENCELATGMATSPEGNYAISLSPAATATTYTLLATAQNEQANDEKCTKLMIDHRGQTTSKPGADGEDENQCWGS